MSLTSSQSDSNAHPGLETTLTRCCLHTLEGAVGDSGYQQGPEAHLCNSPKAAILRTLPGQSNGAGQKELRLIFPELQLSSYSCYYWSLIFFKQCFYIFLSHFSFQREG